VEVSGDNKAEPLSGRGLAAVEQSGVKIFLLVN